MKIARQMATDYLVFFGGEALAVAPDNNGRERGRECCAHSVGVYGDFCALCGRGGEVHRGRGRGGKQPDWCIRQMLGTANFNVGPLAFASGTCAISSSTICSPTCAATATLRSLPGCGRCADKFDLPYATGSPLGQYLQKVGTIHKWALPDRFLTAASRHNARET